jgi:hypothetical protein
MIELEERDRLRKTYQVCRLGFGILALALILASLTFILSLAYQFTLHPIFREIFGSSWYHWIDAPIIWASLIGTTFLWGRWESPSWQRRVGLLMVMCLADVILWVMSQGSEIGIINRDFGHEWLRSNLGQALGWAELALISTLAADYLVHLGVGQVDEAAKSIRSLVTTGAAIWMVLFCAQTDWRMGWPLRPGGRIGNPEGLLLTMGVLMIQTIILIQVTGLTLLATRQSSQAIADLDRDDPFRDFFNPQSGSGAEDHQEAVSSHQSDAWS